jgi:hypothetical protein
MCYIGNKLERTVDSGVMSTDNSTTSSPKLSSRDDRIISRLIAANFNVPISQRLRDGSLIDQLQIKRRLNNEIILSSLIFYSYRGRFYF